MKENSKKGKSMSKLIPPDLQNIKSESEPTISVGKCNTINPSIDPNLEPIKLFGLQRSGTNWLGFLINQNFKGVRVLVNEGGWKHGHYIVPWALNKEIHIISLIKNPYSWLVSVYNYWGPNRKKNIGPDLRGVDFNTFVRNRYLGEQQKSIPFILRAKNPVQHWNNMNIHWLSVRLNTKKSCFVTYETLMGDLSNSLKAIGQTLGLEAKHKDQWVNNDNIFLPGYDNVLNVSNDKFDNKYYENQGWKKYYTPELLEFVNNELDLDLMIQFGYMPMQPEELC